MENKRKCIVKVRLCLSKSLLNNSAQQTTSPNTNLMIKTKMQRANKENLKKRIEKMNTKNKL